MKTEYAKTEEILENRKWYLVDVSEFVWDLNSKLCHRSIFIVVLFSLFGLVLGTALFIIPYLMGGMGAGDIKLMGAVGAITGPKGVLLTALFSSIIGGVYALIVLLFNIQYLKDLTKRSLIMIKSFVFTKQLILKNFLISFKNSNI